MLYTSGKIIAMLLLLLFIILLVTMHAWVSFEVTAEVYNEVCRDGCTGA